MSIPTGPFYAYVGGTNGARTEGMDALQTRGERTCTFIRIGKGRRAGGGSGASLSLSLPLLRSLSSPLLPLLKHLAFSQAHFCSQSTTHGSLKAFLGSNE